MTARRHLVTGGGSGIGLALARLLVGRGDRVVLVARSQQRAEEMRESLPEPEYLVLDLAEPRSLAVGAGALAGLGPLDSLVHCAGAVDLAEVGSLDESTWNEQIQVNLTAPALLTRSLLPNLREATGQVVFVNSTSGLVSNPRWGAYAAAKSGLRALADALRAEEAEHGIRVTSVFPSRTATPMQARVHEQEGRDYDAAAWLQPESVAATIAHVLDLPADATIPEVTIRTAPAPTRA